MAQIIKTAYTFDDVLLVPNKSEILPNEVSLKTKLTKKISLKVGKKKKIAISGKVKKAKYTFKSSKKAVASVSKSGVVTAKKAGIGKTVTITAKATDGSGKKATIKIKIKK